MLRSSSNGIGCFPGPGYISGIETRQPPLYSGKIHLEVERNPYNLVHALSNRI